MRARHWGEIIIPEETHRRTGVRVIARVSPTETPASATVMVLMLLLLGVNPSLAGPLHYLARNELLCEPSKVACVRATLSYEQNDRLLRLRGRLVSAPGPGLIRITVTGTTRQGYRRYAPMEIPIRGQPTEIVDFKMIPDHPDVYDWAIDRVEFIPAEGTVPGSTY